ncbi:MAG: branched-chain-amino-acid transaminase [Verrucomicrobia bacterium]|nr:branched-chain-amino-acid transaminase [Verrucomicrobiota bacterium]MCG2679742.1 branched-chain-amino-acid transaminase [Kiritimatiellia bacterium]MBU4248580.1 branched-chain-amino-acid transaminase [Verrucomicrobiota bacterium]MBU4291554.1 branched-chain-amino-acid transaminase [Verrucomicrobiota bacterium]MBU4430437.1 branched-chain-amino-acid transaminase [Verrucomicrobiota bacterium]
MKVYLNGKLVPLKDAKVSVFDHGLLYGDGVFEGIRSYHGRVFMLEAHIDRLFRSAHAIVLDIPMTKQAVMRAVVATCKANNTMNGYVRLVITRGIGTLGLNPYSCRKPQVIIIADKIQLYSRELYTQGLKVVTAGSLRNHSESLSPCIKSLNYLNNIMAKLEAINSGVEEVVMLNPQGNVAEASGDNIFIFKGNQLLTPPISAGALEGITRNVVMDLARRRGYEVREITLTRYDLYTSDEMFLTGTGAEIISVVDMDRRVIGTGKPGRRTLELTADFREFASKNGVPIE